MKGLVFNEFLEMVENKFGFQMSVSIISQSNLPTNGVYSSVGTYDYKELVSLVVALSKETNISVQDLLKIYGEYLFTIFVKNYSVFLVGVDNLFVFLCQVEEVIHVEVKKLYPDADLPKFKTEIINGKEMNLIYYSNKALYDFAVGLIHGAATYYKVNINVDKILQNEQGTEVLLNIKIID